VDIKKLVASVASVLTNADIHTIYSMVIIAKEEMRIKTDIPITTVEEAVRQLVEEGYLVEYEETSLDLSKKEKKYIATEKIRQLAEQLPPKILQLTKMKYITPSFYYLLNYTQRK